jgi:hypothetical protein
MSETKIGQVVEANTAAMHEGGKAAAVAFQDLAKAYQDLATKNATNLKSGIQALTAQALTAQALTAQALTAQALTAQALTAQALTAVKSPAEFIEVEQRLIKEGVQAAVSDSQNIAKLTAAVFTVAFEPVKQRIQSLQKPA